ncbi:hypothetical protein CCHR01_19452 [Colletotrichum chrysophilum]|uniref:Uncharacterized protein n=1 Tax=Colletotrichum chrysophilum TaxID=1836956 RepID=A0AAD8ZYL2_9PEZI|nr:hypothetical protein CCHR01_19452 [Colletotrichum chrysophilum]
MGPMGQSPRPKRHRRLLPKAPRTRQCSPDNPLTRRLDTARATRIHGSGGILYELKDCNASSATSSRQSTSSSARDARSRRAMSAAEREAFEALRCNGDIESYGVGLPSKRPRQILRGRGHNSGNTTWELQYGNYVIGTTLTCALHQSKKVVIVTLAACETKKYKRNSEGWIAGRL